MKAQSVSIRLLRKGKQPREGLKDKNIPLEPFENIDGALIALDANHSGAPAWTEYLELSKRRKDILSGYSTGAYCLVFLEAKERWFAVSFGMGHHKLDPNAFVEDFGLRVVLNEVNPSSLRSVDVRTLDENPIARRTQAARRSDQTAFGIDIERDIMRSVEGVAKDCTFATNVTGNDSLKLTKRMVIADLPQVCADTLAAFNKTVYKTNFAWIDQIKQVRLEKTKKQLNRKLAEALTSCLPLNSAIPATLHLAYPIIYDPEQVYLIQYKGFYSSNIHTDLEIDGYVSDMREKSLLSWKPECLGSHKVCEVNANGETVGQSWNIKECLIYETDLNGDKYVLSAGYWYRIDRKLANKVSEFFKRIPRYRHLPDALQDENEESYNRRIARERNNFLCLDRVLIQPTGASSKIEACDFLDKNGAMIHIKNKTAASKLSHLFNQGIVSASAMKADREFREQLQGSIKYLQDKVYNKSGYEKLVKVPTTEFKTGAHLIVYGVICPGAKAHPKEPSFFNLVTLRRAAKELGQLGFQCAFAWINQPECSTTTKAKPKSVAAKANRKRGMKMQSAPALKRPRLGRASPSSK